MMFRKLTSPGRTQPATRDTSRFCDGVIIDAAPRRDDGSGWQDAARELGRRLMPVLVLTAAALLGLAAVAMA